MRTWIALVFLITPLFAQDLPISLLFAQETHIPNPVQVSVMPENTRYQVVQPNWYSREAYRLDRFTGQIDSLSRRSDTQEFVWQEIEIVDRPAVSGDLRPRFHLFWSAMRGDLSARRRDLNVYLIDLGTGKTWLMFQEKGKIVLRPLKEERLTGHPTPTPAP